MSYNGNKTFFWNAFEARNFIDTAKTSSLDYERREPYSYKKMPKNIDMDTNDVKKTMISQALAEALYGNDSPYRTIPLHFYEKLCTRLASDRNTMDHFNKNIIPLVKGNVSYNMMTEEKYPDTFKHSDLDIVICINPNLPDTDFNYLQHSAHIILNQAISQYKRTLDHMFFGKRLEIDNSFMSDEEIEAFINKYEKVIDEINKNPELEGKFLSPFTDNYETRNFCSKFSFIITDTVNNDQVVRCEIPHLAQCDRIPLKKTPLFISYNDSINFNRAKEGEAIVGNFNLYRIKINHMFISFSKEEDSMKKVSADLIDISIPKKDDAELINFWKNNKSLVVCDKITNIWVYIPDILFSIKEIDRMINLYKSPENKKGTRLIKREMLINHLKDTIVDFE